MSIFSGIGKAIHGAIDGIEHAIGIPSADDKKLMNEQIQAYKNQTALADSEIARKRDQELVEKRRIDEKTIRSLRRSYRPAGFMDSSSDIGSNLGS